MDAQIHEPTNECGELHCYTHNVDEPDSEWVCGECAHAWPTAQALLADHNRLCAENGVPLARFVREVYACPFCTHDL